MKNICREIIDLYYPEGTPLRELLLEHSEQVRRKALNLLAAAPDAVASRIDSELVETGALLHDIGIGACHAPGILCEGDAPYIAHGVIGAERIRSYGASHGKDLERLARICERHTGSGLTAQEIRQQGLPLPERDYLPETLEEKLICLADKFYSKSGDRQEKSFSRVRRSMEKFGADSLARFDALCAVFGLKQ